MTDEQPDTDKDDSDDLRARTARLMHDVATPLLTVRALAEAIAGDDPARLTLKAGIDRQLNRVQALLDQYWQVLDGTTMAGRASDEKAAPQPAEPLTILVIDDDEIHREIACRLLGRLGHTVHAGADGLAARALEAEIHFDLVLLDQHTPHESGTDYARAPRPAGANPAPYFAGMSSDPRSAEIAALCKTAGMQDYLEKPLTLEKLAAMLGRYVTRRGS